MDAHGAVPKLMEIWQLSLLLMMIECEKNDEFQPVLINCNQLKLHVLMRFAAGCISETGRDGSVS